MINTQALKPVNTISKAVLWLSGDATYASK